MKIESEKVVERHVVTLAKQMGGVAVKLIACHSNGIPDRMVLLPGGKIMFLELKTTGRKPTELQKKWLAHLQSLGFRAEVADTKEGVTNALTSL